MTLKQKSELQRLLGNIEGAAFACESKVKDVILDSIQAIDEILRKDDKNNENKNTR